VPRPIPLEDFCIVLDVCFVSSALAYPQDPEQGQGPIARGGGRFTLESSLGIEALHDSNIWGELNGCAVFADLEALRPSLLLRFEPTRSHLEFRYQGNYGWYDESSHDGLCRSCVAGGARTCCWVNASGLDLVASYDEAHENRGTGLSVGIDPASGAFPQGSGSLHHRAVPGPLYVWRSLIRGPL